MRQYAIDYGAQGVRANAVNADRIRTGLMTDDMIARRSAARGMSEADYMGGNLLKQEVTADDVAPGLRVPGPGHQDHGGGDHRGRGQYRGGGALDASGPPSALPQNLCAQTGRLMLALWQKGGVPMPQSRYTVFVLCLLLTVVGLVLIPFWEGAWIVLVAFGLLSLLGVLDLTQTHHTIQRNYPVIGHMRWMVEFIRPEIRQYLIESDQEAAPFSRSQRSLVYQRAKGDQDDRPFGTLLDVYAVGYEWIAHSTRPVPASDPESFRITIGGPQCTRPYSASVFNISAMSFGSLSAAAISALNRGAKAGGFYHDTGEGSISPYHREGGGDIVWEIASGYFGCRTAEGRFDPDKFAAQATTDQVKMIEIKLSQGAKPGHGGVLPAAKVTQEISETRGVPMGVDCISPPLHSAFSTPREMMAFIAELRRLSGGKPVGFKLCLGHPWEFMGMVKAMMETGVLPRLHRGRRGRGRHRRGPHRVRRPHRHAHARGAIVRAQHPRRGRACATVSRSASPAAWSAPSTWPRSWPSARTGATPRAASCSPWAASSP